MIDKEKNMQNNENETLHENMEQLSELMYKLELSCSKVEQCAFDSINVTDQVMNGLQKIMEIVQTIASNHEESYHAMKIGSVSLEDKEGENLLRLAHEQASNLAMLEMELHKVVEASMEANDAARSIEAGVLEQSENIAELVQCNENILAEMMNS